MTDHWYYDKRDRKGRFAKVETINWSEEKSAMTIENETGQEVNVSDQLPANIPVQGDENMIRNSMEKFTDWVLKFSTMAKKMEEFEARTASLSTALENAELRVIEANRIMQAAKKDAETAVNDARMAREAYTVVAKEREELSSQLTMVNNTNVNLAIDLDNAMADLTTANNAVAEQTRLMEVARTERDSFREKYEASQIALENVEHEHTQQIVHRNGVIASLEKERDGLHHKVNGLEDEVRRLSEELRSHRGKLASVRQMLN